MSRFRCKSALHFRVGQLEECDEGVLKSRREVTDKYKEVIAAQKELIRELHNDRHVRGYSETTCPPLPPEDGDQAVSTPLHLPLSTRLDEISLRPAAQSEPFYGPFGPPS
jgi:hypothetical protein